MAKGQEKNKSPPSIEDVLIKLSDEKLCGNFDDIFRLVPVTKDTSCGVSFIRGTFLQKFANKKVLVFLYGLLSLVFASSGSYFNATITTMEKRYKISSRNMGIISVGNDISSLFLSAFISYYGGKSNRPRWIGVGLFSIVIFCLMNASLFFYGPGEEALALTVEYGAERDESSQEVQIAANKKYLCLKSEGGVACDTDEGSLTPQILLFVAQIIAGVGQTICSTLGISYLDDNIKKTKTPALMSISFFMRLLGPALGYTLASACLKIYIAPNLTPVIDNRDPRWIGAWFIGWLLFAVVLLVFAFAVSMFPKELPRAALRRRIEEEKIKRGLKVASERNSVGVSEASLSDMVVTFKRLFKNKTFMLMQLAGILHIFGFLPYWIYTPKMIETLYHQTASSASFYTGTLAIVFSGVGVLLGGLFISKFKPSARFLAMWHVIAGILCTAGIISYAFIGCTESEKSMSIHQHSTMSCNQNCHCDFVKYSPVCGKDSLTYISACHAGCSEVSFKNSSKVFEECSCVGTQAKDFYTPFSRGVIEKTAKSGPCAVNCQKELMIFLIIMCTMKFIGATGRTSNFLVSIRCIDQQDKSVAIGLGATLIHLFAFIPSPILFGYILDRSCLVFGKTCNGTGNCWLYDSETFRYLINFTAALFIALGTIVDLGVWYFVKDLRIFDEEDLEQETKSEATVDIRL